MEKPKPNTFLAWLRRWLLSDADRDTRYLCAATDITDLERRLRVLERCTPGTHFATFNH
jgi:hypothetical protein